ncbi:MAG: beta-glucanase (GH16 family), partial [Flavobacteriales bacterium]
MKYALISMFFIGSMSLQAQNTCEQLVWSDEFEGTEIDMNNWSFELGNGCPNLCGWGNGELQYYTDS